MPFWKSENPTSASFPSFRNHKGRPKGWPFLAHFIRTMAFTFLSADWCNLIFANYPIDRAVLQPLVPHGTELDDYNGVCFGSLVGFNFEKVRMLGEVPVPFHTEFEEFNLRFYVRRKTEKGWQRGVVFVKEIVPKPAIVWVAWTLYGEPYEARSMRHTWQFRDDKQHIRYEWQVGDDWNYIDVEASRVGEQAQPGSEEWFITENYWGYTARGTKHTSEFEVVHDRWQIYPVSQFDVRCDVAQLYGPQFAPFFTGPPSSVFLADGAPVTIRSGQDIKA